ncbi:MAG: hypothetical protein JWQ07_293 [Ramlibacter sp.]|nr:hypothetical protein [Ramlibacter sp.]
MMSSNSWAEGEDFDHPAVPDGNPLRRHCLYRLARANWRPDNA